MDTVFHFRTLLYATDFSPDKYMCHTETIHSTLKTGKCILYVRHFVVMTCQFYWKSFLGNLRLKLTIRHAHILQWHLSSAVYIRQKEIQTKQLLFQTKVQKCEPWFWETVVQLGCYTSRNNTTRWSALCITGYMENAG